MDFNYPAPAVEAAISAQEAGIADAAARRLVQIGEQSRRLRGHGLDEGASTRMLIHAGRLLAGGVSLHDAVRAGVVLPITDDADMRDALENAIAALAA